MLATTATQDTIIASNYKSVSWLFDITDKNDVSYNWSTKAYTFDGTNYTFKIINFRGVTLNRATSEMGIQSPSGFSFGISNKDNTISASDLAGGTVLLRLAIGDGTNESAIRQFKFKIKHAADVYQSISVVCEDFIQQYLEGDYPNTASISALFPPADKYEERDLCVPATFGTPYIPLRPAICRTASVSTPERFYLLGEVGTYSISKVRQPRTFGSTVWSSGSYAFTQSTVSDTNGKVWQAFQPIIAKSSSEASLDSCGLWAESDSYMFDMPAQFSKSSSVATTNPRDVIESVLLGFGTPSTDIDSAVTFASADSTYDSWGLAFNGAFYYKEARGKLLASLLNQCHSTLYNNEKIELHVLSKTSQKTITSSDVVKSGEVGKGTFKTSAITQKQSDSGYIAYQKSDDSQDELVKYMVPAKSTTDNVSNDTLAIPFVKNSDHTQRLGSLYFQRKLLKESTASFTGKAKLVALQPDDVITINDTDYGGNYDVLIDSMTINKDASISFKCTKFKSDLDDWDDLSFGVASLATETPINYWSPVIAGPDSDISGVEIPNLIKGRLRVGASGDFIMIDPTEGFYAGEGVTRIQMKAGVGFWAGATIFGDAPFSVANAGVLTATSATITGSITATSGAIGGFTVSAVEGLYAGANATRVQMKAGVGFWAGATLQASAPFRVTAAGAITATGVTITGALTTGAGSDVDGQYLTALSVATGSLGNLAVTAGKIANTTITATQIAGLTITAAQIANTTITGGKIAALTIEAGNIKALTITSDEIANATITTTQISGTAAITGGQIATATLTSDNITNLTIVAGDIANNTITAGQIAATTITAAEIADLTIVAGKIANATLTATQIANNTITATQILGLTVTAAEIANATITGGKIAATTITASNITALTITAAEIANATITTTQISGTAAITGTQIASATITSDNITDLSIVAGDIANATITGGKIAATTITAANITALTVTASEIANATITGAKIAATTIEAGNIKALTITSDEIAAATITGGKIALVTVAAANIVNATITGAKIAATTITAGNIVNSTITGGKIAANTVTGGNIAATTIVAGNITNLTITAAQIANLTITGGGATGKLAESTIAEYNIVANTITAASIAATTITAAQIVADTITANEIAAATITTAEIAADTIVAANIAAGTITATQIDVGNLIATQVLVAADIADLNLVGYWSFNDGTGTTAIDGSGNENHGTLTNMEEADWVDGVVGKCLDFDGVSSQYVDCGSGVYPVSAISVSVWLNPSSFQTGGAAIGSSVNDGSLLFYSTGTDVRFYIRVGSWHSVSIPQSDISLDVWYHFVLTYDQTDLKVFMDGVEKKSTNLSGDITSTGSFRIGTYRGTDFFNGLIDEVRIYSTALTASEIKALYDYPAGV